MTATTSPLRWPRPRPGASQSASRIGFPLAGLWRHPALGAAGLLIFVFGMLLVPLAHSVGHRSDHTHGGGRGRDLDLEKHEHATAPHEHAIAQHEHPHNLAHEDQGDSDDDDQRHEHGRQQDAPFETPDPHHGEGSFEHFGVALPAAALSFTPPGGTPLKSLLPITLESIEPCAKVFAPLQARAPPL